MKEGSAKKKIKSHLHLISLNIPLIYLCYALYFAKIVFLLDRDYLLRIGFWTTLLQVITGCFCQIWNKIKLSTIISFY